MNFELTKSQQMIEKAIADFMKKECPPEYTRELDQKKQFPDAVWQKLADNGFLGVAIPETYGGSGGDIMDYVLVIKEICKGSIAVGFGFFLSICFGGKSIGLYGTEEQKKHYLPDLVNGKCKFSLSLTEPGGGTDIIGALDTRAEVIDDHYIINGQKTFISGADVADYFITVLRTDENSKKKSQGISILIVDAKTPGIKINPIPKMAIPAVSACEVFYDNVKVPKSALLGTEGEGWYQLVSTLDNERIGVAAMTLGLAEGIFDLVVKYAKDRRAFGKPIGQFQSIQHYLAKNKVEMDAAKMLLFKSAWLQSRNKRCDVEASMAKYYASKVSFEVVSKAISIMGGYGVMDEYDVGRHLHAAKLFTLAPISNEMALNYIGTAGLGLPKSY